MLNTLNSFDTHSLDGAPRFLLEFLYFDVKNARSCLWSSWSLLVVMTFAIIAHLKHIKASIHVPDA